MAYSIVPKIRRDGVITLIDGTTPSAVTLEVAYEEGDLSIDEPSSRTFTEMRDRGAITNVRGTDDQIITGSFSFQFRQFTDASEAGSVRDFLKGRAFYSANISTGLAGSPRIDESIHCVDLQYVAAGTANGDDADHTITLSKCAISSMGWSEGDPGTFTVNFSCYGGAVEVGPT